MNVGVFLQIVGCILVIIVVIIVIVLMVLWGMLAFVNVLVDAVDEIDFSRKVAKEYEKEFIQRIINGNEYNELIKTLDVYEEKFFEIICRLSYNYLMINRKKYETIDNLTTEIVKILLDNPILEKIEVEANLLLDKKVLIKSLVHRAYLKVNDSSKWLQLKQDKLCLRNLNSSDVDIACI